MSSPSRLRFNKSSLESLPLPVANRVQRITTRKSLACNCVTDRGVKSFCVFRRSKRGRPERITIGRFPMLSVERARAKAKRYLADLGEGISISGRLRNEALLGKTLGEVHREYLSSRG